MIKQRALELFWTLTRLFGLQFLHEPGALRRALIGPYATRFSRPQSQYKSFYRALPKATALRLSTSAAMYGKSRDQAALKEIVETLTRYGDYSQAARWCSKVVDLSIISQACIQRIKDHTPTPFLRIGRGDFPYPLWKNFNVELIALTTTGKMTLPIRSASCAMVYIEDTFELGHAGELHRFIEEAARSIVPDGVIVVDANKDAMSYFRPCGLTLLSDSTDQIALRYDFIPHLASGKRNRMLAAALKERG